MIGLVSDVNRAAEMAVLNEMRQLGAQILSIGERDTDVALESGLPEAVRGALYLPNRTAHGTVPGAESRIESGRTPSPDSGGSSKRTIRRIKFLEGERK